MVSQCLIIIARYICFNLLCFTTAIRLVLAFLFQSTNDHDATNLLRRDLLLHSTMSTEERRKPEANIQSLTRISIRTMRILSNRIGAPSLDHFRVPMVFFTTLAFTEQELHIDACYVSRFNAFASHIFLLYIVWVCTNTFICGFFSNSWLSHLFLLLLFVRQWRKSLCWHLCDVNVNIVNNNVFIPTVNFK